MKGIEKIIVERINQLDQHGYTVESDQKYNKGEFNNIAVALITQDHWHWPRDWDLQIYRRWIAEPRENQLAIAGAFLAAEIDRLQYQNPPIRPRKVFFGYQIIDDLGENETHT